MRRDSRGWDEPPVKAWLGDDRLLEEPRWESRAPCVVEQCAAAACNGGRVPTTVVLWLRGRGGAEAAMEGVTSSSDNVAFDAAAAAAKHYVTRNVYSSRDVCESVNRLQY